MSNLNETAQGRVEVLKTCEQLKEGRTFFGIGYPTTGHYSESMANQIQINSSFGFWFTNGDLQFIRAVDGL